jgi:Lon protease-like protein
VSTQASDDLPDRCGVMILPWVSLFPGALLPLYIFEERYRVMLSAALAGNRFMALAHSDEEGRVSNIGSLGVIRACVTNEDETSHLILQGVSRVKFESIESSPYPRARLTVCSDPDPHPVGNTRLRKRLQEVCRQVVSGSDGVPEEFESYLERDVPLGFLADVVASALVSDPQQKRQLLEVIDPRERAVRLVDILSPGVDSNESSGCLED